MSIMVTGGAGFIGSNFVLEWLKIDDEKVINFDKLTYAGNINNLISLQACERHQFIQGDIADNTVVSKLLTQHQPRAVVHFAAESHVDRSISEPDTFIQTNMVGTFQLLETVKCYWQGLNPAERAAFRFLHISTDEVYGSLAATDPAFKESNRYQPNSPYAASKAAADHLVRAYHHTYGLPTLTANCSNNYGPYQFPEKLIPLMLHHAITHQPLPLYGDGQQRRDWLYVTDHVAALRRILQAGLPGECYNIGGNHERSNLEVVQQLCALLDQRQPRQDGHRYARQITFVTDRPGHDSRYAIDATKISQQLGWQPQETFESGLIKTITWYLTHQSWLEQVTSGAYRSWLEQQYTE